MQTSDEGEVWSKVVALIKSFPTVCGMPPTHKGVRAIPDFMGHSFAHNLCFNHPNGSCRPILDICILRVFSNDIRNSTIQWGLTLVIILWKFKSPSGLQLQKWELIWECEGSFPHTLLHSWEHEMWLLGFPLGPHLSSPCLGCECKARLATLFDV
jgi:hypothetical protein